MGIPPFAVNQRVLFGTLYVLYSDGSIKHFDAVEVGCNWFKMSNDAFYNVYGFNFNPHEHHLYNQCKRIVYGRF